MINLTVSFLSFTTSHAVMMNSAQFKRKECFYKVSHTQRVQSPAWNN